MHAISKPRIIIAFLNTCYNDFYLLSSVHIWVRKVPCYALVEATILNYNRTEEESGNLMGGVGEIATRSPVKNHMYTIMQYNITYVNHHL